MQKTLKDMVRVKKEELALKHNLYLRSIGKPASSFKYDNPEHADGVPILARRKVSDSDPNIKTAFDNFSIIQTTKSGYMSNIVREYTDNFPEAVKEAYREFDSLNSTSALYSDLMISCAGWGNTFTLCVLGDDRKVRIKQVPASSAWISKVDGEERGYVLECHKDVEKVYEYTARDLIIHTTKGGSTTTERVPHGFFSVPLIEWKNNEQRRGNAQKAVGLIDAYDRIISDNVTEFSAFRNAYLLLKDMGTIDDKVKAEMQKSGVFVGTGDAKAEFITKDINPAFAEMVAKEAWSGIWVSASSVDPKALASLSNATAFQISQLFRLMEADAKVTERSWQQSLEKLDQLLKGFWTTIGGLQDYDTKEISYEFKRNLPKDNIQTLESLERAGVDLPQWKRIMLALGVDEKTAKELAEEGMAEREASLPDFGE